jgi:hypothetical protein
MATGGIVPPLDVAEDRHPGLGLRCEPAACQQLAFQRSEEALAHGVIVGVTNRSHGCGDDEARIGQRLGRVVMADEIAAPAMREDDKR